MKICMYGQSYPRPWDEIVADLRARNTEEARRAIRHETAKTAVIVAGAVLAAIGAALPFVLAAVG